MGTNDGRLIAIDASTGDSCPGFGRQGQVVLDVGMELVWPGEFQITSPPVVIGDTVIVGSAISDNVRVAAPHGTVRAFDVRTGEPKWEFDPIPRTVGNPDWQGRNRPWRGTQMPGRRCRPMPSAAWSLSRPPARARISSAVCARATIATPTRWSRSMQNGYREVGVSDRAPRRLGLRPAGAAGTLLGLARRRAARCRRAGDQDRACVRARSRYGRTVSAGAGSPMPASDIDGEVLSPTQPIPESHAALVPSRIDPDDAFGLTWFDKRACSKQICRTASRRSVHTAVATGNAVSSVHGRRRELGRCRL